MLLDSSRATTPQLLLDSSRATTPVARWSYKLTCCLVTAVACQETSRLFHTPRLGVLLEGLSPPTWTLSTLRVPATYCAMLGVYDLIWLRLWAVLNPLLKIVVLCLRKRVGSLSSLVALHHLPSHPY